MLITPLETAINGEIMGTREGSDLKITKWSFIPLETLVAAVIMAVALTGIWIRGEVRSDQNTEDIASLKVRLEEYAEGTTIELIRINKTLGEMLVQDRIKNELAAVKMGDRWTSHMQEEYSHKWLEVIQEYHPDLKLSDLPTVIETQEKFGFSRD